MKRLVLMIIPALICGMAFTSCASIAATDEDLIDDREDGKVSILKEGTYSGTFTVTYSSGKKTGTTTLKLENGKYICTGNPDFIPAGGSGTYSINNDKIVFVDENFWTANFDWNLILTGEYNYTFNGKKLKISAHKNDVGFYEYDLE